MQLNETNDKELKKVNPKLLKTTGLDINIQDEVNNNVGKKRNKKRLITQKVKKSNQLDC